MFRKHPLLWRFGVFVLIPLLAVAGYASWHLSQSLPPGEGEIAAPGLAQRVTVERDAHGVTHVSASSDRDAFFAIGYVHAQDRMWQLELQRLMAQGRLSEVFGKGMVQQDIWFRTLGIEQSAHSAWTSLSPEAKDSLQAYADGINAWLSSGTVLPAEFQMLGVQPEPWTVYDSLAWVKVLALNLGGNYRREIERLVIGQMVGTERMQDLFPAHPRSGLEAGIASDPDQLRAFARMGEFLATLETDLQLGGRYVGSNAWAVAGAHSKGGGAVIANDPHLGLQIPSLWYMASLKGGTLDVSGATLVGMPMVMFGRNDAIAWAGTNLMADVQDLYLEQVKPDDHSKYRVGESWVPFDLREETIRVKQDFPAFMRSPFKPLQVRVRSSRHGPIVSDMVQMLEQPAALRWTALDSDDSSYEAFFRLNYARNWDEFQAALGYLVAPAMNVLYADRLGNIGQLSAGRIPVRANGEGLLPVPGWDSNQEWIGSIPFADWPRSYNPERGFVVSANNKPVAEDYPYLISHDWAPPARADRISRLLSDRIASGKPIDADEMGHLQGDTVNEPARRLLVRLLKFEATNPKQQRAMAYLSDWDGDMRRDSQAATIFNAWSGQIKQRLIADDLSGHWNTSRASRYAMGVLGSIDLDSVLHLLDDPQGRWCDNRATDDRIEDCDRVLGAALDAAIAEVLKVLGDESMESWAWGEMHHTVYRHMPFSQTNVMRSLFQRKVANGGSPDSINVSGYALEESGYAQDFGAGFRQVISMSEGAIDHIYMNSTGQSGNVLSPHYDDMVEPFRDVRFLTMTRAGAAGNSVLIIVPQASASQGGAR